MRTESNHGSTCWTRIAAAGVLLAAGCAAPGGRQPTPPNAIVLDVPLVTQEAVHECGLASIAALTAYHGCSIPPEVKGRMRAAAEQRAGLTGAEIQDGLQASGLHASIVAGALDRSASGVYRHLDRGRPLLVMADRQAEALHATLLVGYDPDSGAVLHLDPLRGSVWEPAEDFAAAWEPAGRFALIATPPSALDAQEATLLGELETVASTDLSSQLAGDMAHRDVVISNNELTTVLLVLGIVLLVVILL